MGYFLYATPPGGKLDPKTYLGGIPAKGKKAVRIPMDDNMVTAFLNSSAHADMLLLDAALHKYPGTPEDPTVVGLRSRTSEVGDKWQRELGPKSDIDPDTVVFYFAGDPETRDTGACFLYPKEDEPAYPGTRVHYKGCPTPPEFHGGNGVGCGLPIVCRYFINVVIAEYDGWAMCPPPAGLKIPEIKDFLTLGTKTCLSRRTDGPHGAYQVPLTDSRVRRYSYKDQPTVNYYVLPADQIPGISLIKRIFGTWRADDKRRRLAVNPAYTNLPVKMPIPA